MGNKTGKISLARLNYALGYNSLVVKEAIGDVLRTARDHLWHIGSEAGLCNPKGYEPMTETEIQAATAQTDSLGLHKSDFTMNPVAHLKHVWQEACHSARDVSAEVRRAPKKIARNLSF